MSEEEEDYFKIELPRLNKRLYKLEILPTELINRLSLQELNNDVIHKFQYLNKKRIRRIHKFLLLFFFLSVLNVLFGVMIKNLKAWIILLSIISFFQILSIPSIFFINKDHFKNTCDVIQYLNETYENRSIKFQYIKKYGMKHYKNGKYYIYIYKSYNTPYSIIPVHMQNNNINAKNISINNENTPLL
ncbi:hypothetical protein DICPUDRAFT_80043 [Dictyostelium purpureum]|uniref:Uncharacterized protein n=1 Tax=Dictyostelium purpureum TaxID=5786 RepID=F0ZPC8_DICPU|nr:uncharacterized protein DICPUDRAFT_80043 [Dictyostelium purpureum]EGC34211.1 hypothetical protein DICPUDRAFT_80043 [Dictyostelium purpureum]|eukprot:XP_003289263.1 hypothetical protein DICPUDRAFT_80043 [Dictyostelium purpureum]